MKRLLPQVLGVLFAGQSVLLPVLADGFDESEDQTSMIQTADSSGENDQNQQKQLTSNQPISFSESSEREEAEIKETGKEASQTESRPPKDERKETEISQLDGQEASKSDQQGPSKFSPVYRMYNPNSGEHFYTLSIVERDSLIAATWDYEGISWFIDETQNGDPLFRLYNPNTGDHHYTTDADERDALVGFGWKDEGISWHPDLKERTPVYRLYNPNEKGAGSHHYTTSLGEYQALDEIGWVAEGERFFAVPPQEFKEVMVNGQMGTVYEGQDGSRASGLQTISGKVYYFDPATNFMVKDTLFTDPATQARYYFGENGQAKTGPVTVNGQLLTFAKNGQQLFSRLCAMGAKGITYNLNATGTPDNNSFQAGRVSYVPEANGMIEKTTFNSIPLYMQTDCRWGNVWFDNVNFANLGCVPTVMASVINTFTSATVTPISLGYLLEKEGYMNGSYSSDKPLGTLTSANLYMADLYGLKCHDWLSLEETRALLKAGGLVSLTAGPGRWADEYIDHQILIYGYDHGNVWVHDPYDASRSGIYTLEYVYNQKSVSTPEEGSTVFGFENPAANAYFDF